MVRGKNLAGSQMRFSMTKKAKKKMLEAACSEGEVDKGLVRLCKFIAATKNFFTTSGCAGRIVLIGFTHSFDKKGSYFLRRWHEPVKAKEIWRALQEKTRGEIWLKEEPLILHIGCRSFEGAKKILRVKQLAGIKRGGIISLNEGRVIAELEGTQNMNLLLKADGKVLVDEKYVGALVAAANKKLLENFKRLKKFERICRKELS